MIRTSLPALRRLSFPLTAVLLVAVSCDRSPPTQPGTAEVSSPQSGGGPPTGEVSVQVNLLDAPDGDPVTGTWLVTFLTTDGDNSAFRVTTTGVATIPVMAPATGCFVARPIDTRNDPLYDGQVPLVWPTVNEVTVDDPGVSGFGAFVSWTNPDGDIIAAPAWRPFLLEACLTHPAFSFARNDGNGPDPDVVLEFVVPPGQTLDVTFQAPQGNGTTQGQTLVPEALAAVPLPRSQLTSSWTSGLDNDQNVVIVISANAGQAGDAEVSLVIPKLPSGWPYATPDPADPCPNDDCTDQEAPPVVIEQSLEPDGAGSFFTSTSYLTSQQLTDPGLGTVDLTSAAFYLMCSIQDFIESPDDGGAVELMGEPGTNKMFFGYQAEETGGNTQDQTEPGDSDIVPITDPWAIGAWWWQEGEGGITVQIRNKLGATTENLNLPINCTEAGGCSAGARSTWSGSLTAFDVQAAVSYQKLSADDVLPPQFKLVLSVTGLPHEDTQARWTASGDQAPDAKLRGKSPKVEEAFGQLAPPPSLCPAGGHNDDRLSVR